MISTFHNSKYLSLNGTISKVPIKKIWILFFGTVGLVVLLIISSDFTDLWGLLIKISVLASTPLMIWFVLRTIYGGDHIRMMAIYRFYFKKNHNKYEVSPHLFNK